MKTIAKCAAKAKEKITKLLDKISALGVAVAAGVAGAATGYLPGFAAGTTLQIGTMVEAAVNIVMGVVVFGGVINVIRGVSMIAKGLQDDGGGQDAAAISKGRGMLIAGVIMIAPMALFKVISGQWPGEFVKSFFPTV